MGQANEEERARWRGWLAEQKESGQSVVVFCRERGVREWQFYEWKKRLHPKTESFVVASQPTVVTVALPANPSTPLEVRLRSGRSVLVGSDFEASPLRRLLPVREQEAMIGLPSLQTLDGVAGPRIWLAAEATDMRCGFDRLAAQVQAVTGESPFSGQLFVFRPRCGSRLKILLWDCDGFVLRYKRLEAGVFKLPKLIPDTQSVELRASELAMLLEGIDLSKLPRTPRYQHRSATA